MWNGLNKPAPRNEAPRSMSKLRLESTEALLKAIEAHKQQVTEESNEVHVGVSCKNSGCDKVKSQINNLSFLLKSFIWLFSFKEQFWVMCKFL